MKSAVQRVSNRDLFSLALTLGAALRCRRLIRAKDARIRRLSMTCFLGPGTSSRAQTLIGMAPSWRRRSGG